MNAGQDGIHAKSFRTANGTAEHIITLTAPAELAFAEQIRWIEERYEERQRQLGLTADSAIFRRVFVSDLLNQKEAVQASRLLVERADNPVAVSVVQQPPLTGAKIALLAYHLADSAPITKHRLSPKHLLVEKNGRRHLWSTRLCAASQDPEVSAAAQTQTVFQNLIDTIESLGGTLRDHCVRTWIYVKDVDVFYHGMVQSRTALFEQQGLTADTHYIASTGIEGSCSHQFDVVSMDAYSLLDMVPEQMSFLNDFDLMCPTKDYNVTFERGTRIGYADRAHHFISGTASIDNSGTVLHLGDVVAQLDRALENIDAILRSGGASLADMIYAIVYLRDQADYPRIRAHLAERLPDLPMILVHGPVCRPEWLIEVEGIAIAANDEAHLPAF